MKAKIVHNPLLPTVQDFSPYLLPCDLMWDESIHVGEEDTKTEELPLTARKPSRILGAFLRDETLPRGKSLVSESKREDNAHMWGKGGDLGEVYVGVCSTHILAPNVCKENAVAAMCASVRKELQILSVSHIKARKSGDTRLLAHLTEEITCLRDYLGEIDDRDWTFPTRGNAIENNPQSMWAKLAGKLTSWKKG